MMVGFVVLAITLGSLLAAGLPLLTALIGVGIGVAGSPRSRARSRSPRPRRSSPRCSASPSASTTRCSSCPAIARTSTTAWSRARRRRRRRRPPAAPSCSPALTVIIALVGLLVVNIPFLTVMGLAAAGTVAIAVLIALTLLPALLGFAAQAARPRQPRRSRAAAAPRRRARDTISVRWARFVTRRPLVDRVSVVALLGVDRDPGDAHEARPAGRRLQPTSTHRAPRVRPADGGLRPRLQRPADRRRRRAGPADGQAEAARARASPTGSKKFPGVAAVSPAGSERGRRPHDRLGHPDERPASDETKDLVACIRDKADEDPGEVPASRRTSPARPPSTSTPTTSSARRCRKYIAVVVGLALLLLTSCSARCSCRSRPPPASCSASPRRWAWWSGSSRTATWPTCSTSPRPARSSSFLPVLLIGILFGLAMDYEVFLVSRMREHFVHTGPGRASPSSPATARAAASSPRRR